MTIGLDNEVFDLMVNERLLSRAEVNSRYIIDLSGFEFQDELYECPLCLIELESKDVIGFNAYNDCVCIGYDCPYCHTQSKRPATTLEYDLFLESVASRRSKKNRFYSFFAELR